MRRRRALAGAAAAGLSLAMVGAYWWWHLPLRGLRRAAALRIGYAVEAPYAMLDAQGQVVGEAPAVARLVAAELALPPIEWVASDFDALIPGPEARRFEVVAAGMFVTRERARRVLFSDPSLRVLPGLLVLRGNPLNLRSEAQLRAHPQVRVAALRGSVEAQRLRELGLAAPRLVEVAGAGEGVQALLLGRVQALCLSLPAVRQLALAEPERLLALRLRQQEGAPALGYTAFQFHLQDSDLQQAWIEAQARVIGSPRHLQAIAPYGFGPEDLPGAVRTSHLIEPP
jgi:polar amino acid transport system substrate-binding protein